MVDQAPKDLDEVFSALYAVSGRASIPPEKLLRAQLLIALYAIRGERQWMKQIQYHPLSRWFVGFPMASAHSAPGGTGAFPSQSAGGVPIPRIATVALANSPRNIQWLPKYPS
jgi:hypothetical protein